MPRTAKIVDKKKQLDKNELVTENSIVDLSSSSIKKLLKKGLRVLVSGKMDYKLEEKGGKRNLKSNIIAKQVQIFDGTT